MVAGGTGITAMYQIIRSVLSDPNDHTRIRLLYANRAQSDIILHKELRNLAVAYPKQFQVRYLVEEPLRREEHAVEDAAAPCGEEEEEEVMVGRVSAEAIEGFFPSPNEPRTALLVCGPPGMMINLCGDASTPLQQRRRREGAPPVLGGLLQQLGYGRQVVQFLDDS